MKYYLHDTSAFDDEKVSELFIEFGYEGVGLFYVTLEKLAKQEKPMKTSVLKSQLKIRKRLEKCWNFMESLGLISSNNGETFNKQLLNYSEKYKIKSEKNAKRISEWREKQGDTKNVTRSENVRNAPKVKEIKVKESKVKKEGERFVPNLDCLDLFWKTQFERWIEHRKEIKKPFTAQPQIDAQIKTFLKLSDNNLEIAEAVIDQAIGNKWQGLYPIKTNTNGNTGFKGNSKADHRIGIGDQEYQKTDIEQILAKQRR
jgi:hypothetical protein